MYVVCGLRGSGSGISVFQCFPLVKVGVLVLFRFRSCNFFFRVVPVVNLSTGACLMHESVDISFFPWFSSVSIALGLWDVCGVRKS
jgi:hypothetical protein